MPKWATQERKRHLVRLFHRSGGFCVFGERPCPCPELHHYEFYIEGLIQDWIAEDRAQAEAEWQAEQEWMHRVPDTRFRQGRFDTVSRAEFLARQPDYYLVGTSVDAFTFKPVAKVRIPSTYIFLFVEISPALKGLSKSKRRKASRYGKPLPQETQETVGTLVQKAVADWWTR
jgi:hypothetical protein